MTGVSNYALKSGASEPCISVTKVEVDGTETTQTGTGNFPAKGSSTAGSVLLSGISATETIAIYFDNSNASGTQINGYYELDWETVASSVPLSTSISPTSAYVAVGGTKTLTGSFMGGDFTGEWVSDNEDVATVSNAGVVTGVCEGTANITYQWADDQSQEAYKATATITVVEAFDASSLATVKTYDFANWGATTLAIESTEAGAIYNAANNVNNKVYPCTNTGLESIAIQAVLSDSKGWTINTDGLYEGSKAGRCAAICDVEEGQYVEFYHNSGTDFYTKNEGEDDGAKKISLVEESGHHVYKVLEDGMVGFELAKGHYVTKIVIYEKKSGTATSLSFSAESATATLGQSFTAPTLTKDPADLEGVTFSSSNTAVATVDAETDEVTLVAGGVATITATFTETEEYWGATASYELTVTDPDAAGYDGETATITWAFNTGASGQTATIAYGSATEELFKSNSVSIGSALTYNGTNTATIDSDSYTETKLRIGDKGSATASANAVKFVVTPKTGMTFTPTKVSFVATRCGTDGGKMAMTWLDGENGNTSLESGVTPQRNNATPSATKYEYDLTAKGVKATTGDCGLQVVLYDVSGKDYALAQIVIEGTLSGSVSAVNTYTITAQLGTDGAGTVSPSEVEVVESEGTTIEATANEGYIFLNWTKESDSSWNSTDNPLTISNVTAEETFTANFKKLYKATYNLGDYAGTLTNKVLCTYNSNVNEIYADADDSYTIPAYADKYLYREGYTFAGWSYNGQVYASGDEISGLTDDFTITPTWTETSQELIASSTSNTVTWTLAKSDIVFIDWQSSTQYGYYTKTATVNGETIAVPMKIMNGKVANYTRTDALAQTNQNTTFTIPAVSGMVVEIANANVALSTTTIAGSTDYIGTGTKSISYTYTGYDETIDIVIGEDKQYLTSIKVTYPVSLTGITKTISSAGYATLYSKYPLDFTGSGLTAYIATISGTAVSFSEVTSIPAKTDRCAAKGRCR